MRGRKIEDAIYPARTKVCTYCNVELPWLKFSPKAYHGENGAVSNVDSQCRACRRITRKPGRHIPDPDNPRLPIAPFREFLASIEGNFDGEADFAKALGVAERILYRWRHENQRIVLDNADAALCKLGLPHMLRELWPELYQFDEPIAA